jgi:hypothetical protein
MELGRALKKGIEEQYPNVKITNVDQFVSRNRDNTEKKGHLNFVIEDEYKNQNANIHEAINALKAHAYPQNKFSAEDTYDQFADKWESPEHIVNAIL